MPRRLILVQLTLAVAAVATIATSQVQDAPLADTTTGTLEGGTSRVEVFANEAAFSDAFQLDLTLHLSTRSGAPTTVTVVPDDPQIPMETVTVTASTLSLTYDLLPRCEDEPACTNGVTIEIQEGRTIDVAADVLLRTSSRFASDPILDVELVP